MYTRLNARDQCRGKSVKEKTPGFPGCNPPGSGRSNASLSLPPYPSPWGGKRPWRCALCLPFFWFFSFFWFWIFASLYLVKIWWIARILINFNTKSFNLKKTHLIKKTHLSDTRKIRKVKKPTKVGFPSWFHDSEEKKISWFLVFCMFDLCTVLVFDVSVSWVCQVWLLFPTYILVCAV